MQRFWVPVCGSYGNRPHRSLTVGHDIDWRPRPLCSESHHHLHNKATVTHAARRQAELSRDAKVASFLRHMSLLWWQLEDFPLILMKLSWIALNFKTFPTQTFSSFPCLSTGVRLAWWSDDSAAFLQLPPHFSLPNFLPKSWHLLLRGPSLTEVVPRVE